MSRMKCPLCGYEFTPDSAIMGCEGCIVHPVCGLLRCPKCYYEFPEERGITKKIRRWWESLLLWMKKIRKSPIP